MSFQGTLTSLTFNCHCRNQPVRQGLPETTSHSFSAAVTADGTTEQHRAERHRTPLGARYTLCQSMLVQGFRPAEFFRNSIVALEYSQVRKTGLLMKVWIGPRKLQVQLLAPRVCFTFHMHYFPLLSCSRGTLLLLSSQIAKSSHSPYVHQTTSTTKSSASLESLVTPEGSLHSPLQSDTKNWVSTSQESIKNSSHS